MQKSNIKSVEVWGSGNVKREFLNVDDLASAVSFCLKKKINNSYINVGSKDYLKIKDLAILVQKITNFKGKIKFNKKYPDGVKERKLDTSILNKFGWKPKINLKIQKIIMIISKNFIINQITRLFSIVTPVCNVKRWNKL